MTWVARHAVRRAAGPPGDATTVVLIDAEWPAQRVADSSPREVAQGLGLVADDPGLVGWDVFDAVLTPGNVILLMSWRDRRAAEAYETAADLLEGARRRRIRIVRDYGMFDRRESPQYYPAVERSS